MNVSLFIMRQIGNTMNEDDGHPNLIQARRLTVTVLYFG